MNIITADFNWVSFLIVVIGVVGGIVKSSKKRIGQEQTTQQELIFTLNEENDNCASSEEKSKKNSENLNKPEMETRNENSCINPKNTTEEEQEVVKEQFDIRKAIISSEILNRPNF